MKLHCTHFSHSLSRFQQILVPNMVVTALLCGKTQCLLNILEHQFQNCLHKLKLAFEEGFVIPGGGITEAACVAKLRQKHSQLNSELSMDSMSSNQRTPKTVSFAMATAWMSERSLLASWRPHMYDACIQGLLKYIARVERNCSSSEDHYGAMAAAEELVKKVVVGGGGRAGAWQDDKPTVLDIAGSKTAAWRRAIELLRLVFLSTRVRMHRNS